MQDRGQSLALSLQGSSGPLIRQFKENTKFDIIVLLFPNSLSLWKSAIWVKGANKKVAWNRIVDSYNVKLPLTYNSHILRNALSYYIFTPVTPHKENYTYKRNVLAYKVRMCNLALAEEPVGIHWCASAFRESVCRVFESKL